MVTVTITRAGISLLRLQDRGLHPRLSVRFALVALLTKIFIAIFNYFLTIRVNTFIKLTSNPMGNFSKKGYNR